RLLGRLRQGQAIIGTLQDAFQDRQVLGLVVHQQNVNRASHDARVLYSIRDDINPRRRVRGPGLQDVLANPNLYGRPAAFVSDITIRAGVTTTVPCSPVWRCNPRRRPPDIFPDPLSSPWP